MIKMIEFNNINNNFDVLFSCLRRGKNLYNIEEIHLKSYFIFNRENTLRCKYIISQRSTQIVFVITILISKNFSHHWQH